MYLCTCKTVRNSLLPSGCSINHLPAAGTSPEPNSPSLTLKESIASSHHGYSQQQGWLHEGRKQICP